MDFYYFISLWILGLSYYWTFVILQIYYDFIKLIRQFIHPGLEEVNLNILISSSFDFLILVLS